MSAPSPISPSEAWRSKGPLLAISPGFPLRFT
ncbi:hypothetical protein IPA_07865 [Ignicoccus pacificus DSM 13166]|uniref:Uncharacterized protein n=1 Tax=Ignicoccus pacificus DSM 13166 TaxID=940294 RepID=A0A977PL80_9CREN|nr:hypothetical protein IPA_07865 [Ignicoccus pacificus DSM 13166]